VQKRPLVIEQERINFEYGPGVPKSESPIKQEPTCGV